MTGSVGRDALPEGVRALAESTVDQTREAYDRSADAFEASVRHSRNPLTLPAKAPPRSTARSSTSHGGILNSSFDLAKSLAGAKNLADMVELQMAYWQKQFGALTAQAEEVHALSTKLTVDTAEPIKALAARKHG